jgi:transcriptional regulator with XRE-family HTH domain
MKSSSNKILKQFGDNLRKVRKEYNISQEQLAFKSGFDRTYISLLERGLRNPSLTTISTLSTSLECNILELISSIK